MYALHNGAAKTTYDTIVVAGFITQWPASPCTVQTMGDCTLRRCSFLDGGTMMPLTNVSAGTVTFTGLTGPIVLSRDPGPAPNSLNWYQSDLGAVPWNDGATFGFQAPGAVAPAFAITVPAASRLRILTPPTLGTQARTFERASGVHITWKPVAAGTVQVIASVLPDLVLTCQAPGNAGGMTIPPEALAPLPATGGGIGADLFTETTQTTGGWPLSVHTTTYGEDDQSGASWSGKLILQ
jgi:hypothetical protein